jgi:hypothetical protein
MRPSFCMRRKHVWQLIQFATKYKCRTQISCACVLLAPKMYLCCFTPFLFSSGEELPAENIGDYRRPGNRLCIRNNSAGISREK